MLILYNRNQIIRPYGEINWNPTFVIGERKAEELAEMVLEGPVTLIPTPEIPITPAPEIPVEMIAPRIGLWERIKAVFIFLFKAGR